MTLREYLEKHSDAKPEEIVKVADTCPWYEVVDSFPNCKKRKCITCAVEALDKELHLGSNPGSLIRRYEYKKGDK